MTRHVTIAIRGYKPPTFWDSDVMDSYSEHGSGRLPLEFRLAHTTVSFRLGRALFDQLVMNIVWPLLISNGEPDGRTR